MTFDIFVVLLIFIVLLLLATSLVIDIKLPKTNEHSLFSVAHYEIYPVPGIGRWGWRLRAANGEIVAVSGQTFESKHAAARAVESARRCGASSKIKFVTEK